MIGTAPPPAAATATCDVLLRLFATSEHPDVYTLRVEHTEFSIINFQCLVCVIRARAVVQSANANGSG
jgi:hypothetical protein